jgi:chaperonin GroES
VPAADKSPSTDEVETIDPTESPGDTLADRLGGGSADKLPIKMMSDRILVRIGGPEGERRSTGGILIPATAQMGKRLTWAEVVATGPSVRQMEPGDHVLFNPEDRYEVEVRGEDFVIMRERDVHAVASTRLEEGSTGLYL